MAKSYFVYILASSRYGTLYVGVTSDLVKRVWQHREGLVEGFTRTCKVKRLVWFETHEDVSAAITREKQIKKWNRSWKIDLIQENNPQWRDLYEGLAQTGDVWIPPRLDPSGAGWVSGVTRGTCHPRARGDP